LEKEILEKAHFSNEPMLIMLSMAVLHFSLQKKKNCDSQFIQNRAAQIYITNSCSSASGVVGKA